MPGDNPTERFDYLFEPLDCGELIEGTGGVGAVATTTAERTRLSIPARFAVVAIVLATAAGTVAMVMLLLRPGPTGQVDAPTLVGPRPTPTSASPIATSQPVTPPPALEAPTVAPAAPQPSLQTTPVRPQLPPITQPPPPEPPQPSAPPPGPEAPLIQTPTTRPPMSVQPEPRAPFPNQTPDYGRDERGGLLGGGGLL